MSDDSSSEDDDEELKAELKATHKQIRKERIQREQQETMYELKEGEEFQGLGRKIKRPNRSLLGDRLVDASAPARHSIREMKFSTKRPEKMKMKQRDKNKKHFEERRKLVRSTKGLVKDKPKYWKSQRVA